MSSKVEVSEPVLSQRGAKTTSYEDFMQATFNRVSSKPYHPTSNPQGIVNLGTAMNSLMEEEVCGRLLESDAFKLQPHHLYYYTMIGTLELRQAVASFLTRHFHPRTPILPSRIVAISGVTSCLDALAHALCDPGDVLIMPTPAYGRIPTNFRNVAEASVEHLVLSQDGDEESFQLRAEDLELRIKELRAEGRRVRAFILINPHNPLGDIYPPDTILSLLMVCARHQVHAIIDEVYALTVFGETAEFHSALSLDLPDPQRTHILWGMSKDFCVAGLRVGVVVTECKEVLACLANTASFKSIPYIIQQAASVLLNDTAWCDEFFLPTNKRRLRAAYQRARERLEGMGAVVREAPAGLFIWFNVRCFFTNLTFEDDMELHKDLLAAGVYTVPGHALFCSVPGWMRLIFAVKPEQLDQGLARLESVLKVRRAALD